MLNQKMYSAIWSLLSWVHSFYLDWEPIECESEQIIKRVPRWRKKVNWCLWLAIPSQTTGQGINFWWGLRAESCNKMCINLSQSSQSNEGAKTITEFVYASNNSRGLDLTVKSRLTEGATNAKKNRFSPQKSKSFLSKINHPLRWTA